MMKFNLFMISLIFMWMLSINKLLKMIHNILLLMFMFLILKFKSNNFYSYMYLYFSFDNISLILIMMNLWILTLAIMANFKFLKLKNKYNFYLIMMFLLIFMNLFFLSMNLFLFYFFFESSLIPIILLIMGWGYQIDRLQASMFMLFYTLFGSLPLFMIINFIYFNLNCISLNLLMILNSNNFYNFLMFIFSISGFLIKMPMYMLHLWLPKAHVESPISGSMILAGTMLKLGSYGLLRFMMFMKNMFSKYSIIIIILSMWGSILCCLICLNMNDMKIIIAYSSIIHMGSLMGSMMTFFYWGYLGSIIMMIAHGICSPGMFYLTNLNYEKIMSRNMNFNKGMINLIPNLSLWWFMILICNMSAPPSINLISEMFLLNSLIYFCLKMLPINMLLIFFSSVYNIFLFYYTQHGKNTLTNFNYNYLNFKEYLILIMQWMPLNFFFLNMNMFL